MKLKHEKHDVYCRKIVYPYGNGNDYAPHSIPSPELEPEIPVELFIIRFL
ncbi:MAG: hypothetical protein GX804_04695 [Lentisphaerae bacterium]|nr:hypothetical protein [Lentisphaerota bacterium]